MRRRRFVVAVLAAVLTIAATAPPSGAMPAKPEPDPGWGAD